MILVPDKVHYYSYWGEVPISIWRWPHFSPQELACKHTGRLKIDEDFLDRIEQLRSDCGFSFNVNSGYRDASHPVEVAKQRPGAHNLGKAMDIGLVHGGQKYEVVTKAWRFGFTGIGIEGGFIHLDTCLTGEIDAVRPALWSY